MQPLNIIFAGTPEFAATSLQALIQSPHNIIAVYTQPDRPAGRGRKLTASPVKELALQHNIPVFQPQTLRDEEEQKKLASLNADLMVVVAYGLILPKAVLSAPTLGCINVHASLLPRWRGAAPIQRAILAGDTKTGVTIMQMDEGLDTGAMLYKVECPIHPDDTSETLHDRLANLGGDALLHTLDHLSDITPVMQDNAAATYAHKIKKEEAQLDLDSSAEELARKVRAFNPWPVAYYELKKKNATMSLKHDMKPIIRVWEAVALNNKDAKKQGSIFSSPEGLDITTKNGILRVLKLQLPGGSIFSAADFYNGYAWMFDLEKLT
ncbi:MAG: methionyl-tRNA formyltransferase [Gammaproteobacteria bacterium]